MEVTQRHCCLTRVWRVPHLTQAPWDPASWSGCRCENTQDGRQHRCHLGKYSVTLSQSYGKTSTFLKTGKLKFGGNWHLAKTQFVFQALHAESLITSTGCDLYAAPNSTLLFCLRKYSIMTLI